MKREIFIKKIDTKRQNSFWYNDFADIAKFTKNDREIIITVSGNIRVQLTNEEFYRKNQQAVDVAINLNLSDKDLKKIMFDECNWFDFLYKNSKLNKWEEIDGDERFTYNSALKAAKDYIEDNEFWKQF